MIVDPQKTIENSFADFAKDLENAQNVEQDKISQYLVESSKGLLKNSNLSSSKLQDILTEGDSKILQAAFRIYFNEKGIDMPEEEYGIGKSPAAAYQPKLTIINSTPCSVNVTPFIHVLIGDCGNFVYPRYAVAAPTGFSTYTNGFSSFPNNFWYNNNNSPGTVTTSYLVNQGYIAYYNSFKFLVDTNCSNISIGLCNAVSSSYTQNCNGCNGGGMFYTGSIAPGSGNPDSTNPEDQDMTLIIIQN